MAFDLSRDLDVNGRYHQLLANSPDWVDDPPPGDGWVRERQYVQGPYTYQVWYLPQAAEQWIVVPFPTVAGLWQQWADKEWTDPSPVTIDANGPSYKDWPCMPGHYRQYFPDGESPGVRASGGRVDMSPSSTASVASSGVRKLAPLVAKLEQLAGEAEKRSIKSSAASAVRYEAGMAFGLALAADLVHQYPSEPTPGAVKS